MLTQTTLNMSTQTCNYLVKRQIDLKEKWWQWWRPNVRRKNKGDNGRFWYWGKFAV